MTIMPGGSAMMSNQKHAFAPRVRHALVAIALLQLILIAPRVAHAEADPIAAVVARVSSAVVQVITVRPPQPEDDKPGARVANTSTNGRTTTAIGSGFIIDPSGYIATNKHVIEGGSAVSVVTTDGVRYPVTIARVTLDADIALLRIDPGNATLPFVGFGDSDKMRVGDRVIAIGSPFGFDTSVSSGIISAVNRDIMESPFDDYIQTDAAINHGNSGGPLFNLSGEVVGMNSVLFSPAAGSAGVGFAVPSNDLKFVYDRLLKTGTVEAGMLPIHLQQVTWMLEQALDTGDLQGALVTSVHDEGGKMLGKIQPGDVIRTFNGQKVLDPRDLARMVARAPVDSDAVLEICRGSERQTVQVTIQGLPEAQPVLFDNDRQRNLGLELKSGRDANNQPIVKVAAVDPNGTAADSGIQKDDVIVAVQQTPVSDPGQALSVFWARSFLKRHFVAVLVNRDGKRSWKAVAVPG
jgi:serine protease Do